MSALAESGCSQWSSGLAGCRRFPTLRMADQTPRGKSEPERAVENSLAEGRLIRQLGRRGFAKHGEAPRLDTFGSIRTVNCG
jgi:hypothetical protein